MNTRILLVGRDQKNLEGTTKILEQVGVIVTGTSDDSIAIDLVGSSQYDALLISRDVSLPDRRYITTQARNLDLDIPVVVVESPEAVLIRLRHAGVTI
ncbi:MAG: hypothetical protein CL753_08330 [Chloroflexi bacterium]|nr:hypothetical protein [Chloroflexota bacterium]|tara:strand:+ start:964 stop:1257 length:294 start_codon:yes stop_codon:yes gene_type:complete